MLRSLDTNIIARAILRDHPVQSPRAQQIAQEPALLLPSVILETFWVLTARQRLSRLTTAKLLMAFLDLPNMVVPDRDAVLFALRKAAAGADFADMLHLALSGGADAFVTFDKAIAAHADGAPVPVETL